MPAYNGPRSDIAVVGYVMRSAKDFEDYARECVHLAGVVQDQELREELFKMARKWMSAAMQAEGTPARSAAAARSRSEQRQNQQPPSPR